MARFTGFKCDRPGCDTTVSGESDKGTTPVGWLRVQVITDKPDDNQFELCSNRCLIEMGIMRYETQEDKTFVRKYGTKGVKARKSKEKVAANNGR